MKVSYYDILVADPYPNHGLNNDLGPKRNSYDLKMPEVADLIFSDGPAADTWPDDAVCTLTQRIPDRSYLYGPGFFVVDDQMKKSLIRKNSGPLEFLETKIINTDGSTAATMHIVRPLTVLECINIDESGFTYDDSGKIISCDRLVVHGDKAFTRSFLMRPKKWPQCILINRYLQNDALNWFMEEYGLYSPYAAYQTGKIKRKTSFPEPGTETKVCSILKDASDCGELQPEMSLNKLKIDTEEFCSQVKNVFDLPSKWAENTDLFSGTLDDLIRHVRRAAKKYRG